MNCINKILNGLRFGGGLFLLYILIQRTIYSWNDVPAVFYFTVLSNLALALFYLTGPLYKSHRRYDEVRGYITLYMLMTGLIFNTLLDPIFTDGLYNALQIELISPITHYVALTASVFTHLIFPLAIVIDFLFMSRQRQLVGKDFGKSLLFPLSYVVFHTLYGIGTGRFLYPFLDPTLLGGYPILALVVVLLTGLFLVLFSFMHRFRNWLQTRLYDEVVQSHLASYYH